MPGAIHGLQIKNGQRSLFLKCKTSNTQAEWHKKLAIDLKKVSFFSVLFLKIDFIRNSYLKDSR